MRQGDIFYRRQFEFEDGTKSPKILIALNDLAIDPFLLVLTTSQQHGRSLNSGCHAQENYFTIQSDIDFFDKPTWVLFRPLIALDAKAILQWGLVERDFETKGRLKESTVRSIINCIKQSPDIPKIFLSLLKKSCQSTLTKESVSINLCPPNQQ